jgi:hypothetical protein
MAGFSNYEAARILNHQARAATLTKRANNYIALFTADPTDTGSLVNEVPFTNGYSRLARSLSDANWTVPATVGGVDQITNAVNFTFGDPTGDWAGGVNITHFAIMDAATAGNMIASGVIGTPRPVLAADNAPTFGPGALIWQLG